jgi:uncharacterized membrane protein
MMDKHSQAIIDLIPRLPSRLEYEQIIKSIIDSAVRQFVVDDDNVEYIMPYRKSVFKIILYRKTDRQIMLDYFYRRIMEDRSNDNQNEDQIKEDPFINLGETRKHILET